VSASGPACFDSGILVVVYHIIILPGVIVVNGRLLPNAFAAAPRWRLDFVYKYNFFSSPSRRRCITFFRAVFGVRINIARARDEYRLKTAAPSCVCMCNIYPIIIVYVIVAYIIIFRRLLSSTCVCVCVWEREKARATGDAQMTFTGLIEMEPLGGGVRGRRVSCTRAAHRLTSLISPSPPKVRRHPALDLSSADDRSRVRFFYTSYYVFTMIWYCYRLRLLTTRPLCDGITYLPILCLYAVYIHTACEQTPFYFPSACPNTHKYFVVSPN